MFSPKSTNEWRYSIIGLTADNKLGNKSMLAPVKNVSWTDTVGIN